MEVAEKMVVSLRYIMKNKEGEEIENTMAGSPVHYVQGAGNSSKRGAERVVKI